MSTGWSWYVIALIVINIAGCAWLLWWTARRHPGDPAPTDTSPSRLPPALLILEPLPEPSPYAPAVLPSRTSDVSELLDSFHVSDAAEERELRSALKGMAGLELTPMPHPYVEEG